MMTSKNRKTIPPQTLCQLLLNLKGILLTHPLLIQMRVKERNQTITIVINIFAAVTAKAKTFVNGLFIQFKIAGNMGLNHVITTVYTK